MSKKYIKSLKNKVIKIYIRVNKDPFKDPYYLFYLNKNDKTPINNKLKLIPNNIYKFIKLDDGHPFNIGINWRKIDNKIIMISTGKFNPVNRINSIVKNESIIIKIPKDIKLKYYCYTHKNMIKEFNIKN
jgi:hypothetical protein